MCMVEDENFNIQIFISMHKKGKENLSNLSVIPDGREHNSHDLATSTGNTSNTKVTSYSGMSTLLVIKITCYAWESDDMIIFSFQVLI